MIPPISKPRQKKLIVVRITVAFDHGGEDDCSGTVGHAPLKRGTWPKATRQRAAI
jgi:hypothetical protein